MPITLVLADDHPIVLEGLKQLFHLQSDFQILACCTDGEETLQAVCHYRPDVLLLDIRMPRKDGLAVLRVLHKEKLPTRVVLLTVELDEEQVLEAMRLGVHGVILKEMAPRLVVECIRKVHAGAQWLERGVTHRAMGKLLRREVAVREITRILTLREMDIMNLLVVGLRNKEVADKLSISEGTVKVHLHHIYEKLHVRTRLELMRYARDQGLI